MCRLKWSLVKQPVPVRSSRKSKSSDDTLTSTSRSTDISGNFSQFSKDSKASTSSANSLATLREALPDNPNIYRFKEIVVATNQFRSGKIGRSSVWRCTLRGKSVVVTERNAKNLKDFKARLLEICSVHHSSIIKLVGGCYEGDHLYLVYEYVEGANLGDCLRGSKAPGYTVLSTWMSRMQIAIDVAQGLEYMHHDTALNYVHNRIKSSSIIVIDPDFRAKIANLGTSYLTGELTAVRSDQSHDIGSSASTSASAEIVEEDQTGRVPKYRRSRSFTITGTQGYMAPEYVENGIVSHKTDVFAFGMILLELLSGNEPVRFNIDAATRQMKRISLIETVNIILSEPECIHKLRAWIDPRLKDSFPLDCAEKVARLASSCLANDPDSRPDMRYVAGELSKIFIVSKKWTEKMQANKELITSTFEGR